jgi:hypothetical protein
MIKGERVRARPTYHHPVYAGLITSITRARLWQMLSEFVDFGPGQFEQQAVIALCTDGLFSTRPLAWIDFPQGPAFLPPPISSDFGALKLKEFDGMQSLQSGVYRTLQEGHWVGRGRGFLHRSVPWDLVNEGWRLGKLAVRYEIERFVGHRWARAQSKYAARSWVRVAKEIHLGAVGKRYVAPAPVYSATENPTTRLYWTQPERDVEYEDESDPNLPDFTRRPHPPPDGTAEDLRDLGWEEDPFEERSPSTNRRFGARKPAGRTAPRVA